jgi:Flp pilus assembly pilin Flp
MQLSKHSRKMNSKKVTGQGMSEYLIIVGLLAVAGIAVMGLMGGTVRTQFSAMSTEIAGTAGGGTADIDAAQDFASRSSTAANEAQTLGTYGDQRARIE